MPETTTANSFIVRVYRIDPEDPARFTGLVEALDGSEERMPFTDISELAMALNSRMNRRQKVRRKTKNMINRQIKTVPR